jgi:hypothetical protein
VVNVRMLKIRIITEASGSVEAALNESETAKAIHGALPLEAKANTWGDEIYFSVPVVLGSERPCEVVEPGDLGYWPPGHAFCIFFGRTPASMGDEIRPASPVNVFGRVIGDPKVFKKVRSGDRVTLIRV